MFMKKEIAKSIIGVVNLIFVFTYVLSLVNGKLPVMANKSIFIQILPMVISLVRKSRLDSYGLRRRLERVIWKD